MKNGSRFAKVAVLMGGKSLEREVSLTSGKAVLSALQSAGVNAFGFDPSEENLFELANQGVDCCFIALHGRWGEDGTIQGALELLGIAYTGPGVMASAIGIDKVMTKRIWQSQGLPVASHVVLATSSPSDAQLDDLVRRVGLPMIVKPVREGSSLGVTRVADRSALSAAILAAADCHDQVMCEQFITGDEVTCSILGRGQDARALPLIRIRVPAIVYDYKQKYKADDTVYLVPSGLPAGEEQAIQALVLKAYRALDCRGWGRIDVMIDAATRKPYLLEINTSPGMTSHSLVPKAARGAGMSYEQLCLEVLSMAALDYDQTRRGAS